MLSASTPGTYVIVIRVPEPVLTRVGNLGTLAFRAGYYAYVGSAMGGLKPRLLRHLSKKKTPRWHADYLTNEGQVHSAVVCQSSERLECWLAQALKPPFISVPGFGCSDCDCPSHLFFDTRVEDIEKAASSAMASLNVDPVSLGRSDLLRFVGLK